MDSLLALGVFGLIGVPPPNSGQRSALEWLLFVSIIVPLLWRRRAPVATFWAVFALFTVADAISDNLEAGFIALLIAAYALARYRSRRHLWPAAAALALAIGFNAQFEDEVLPSIIAPSALLAAVMLLGIYRQTRRAYLHGLIERAERLERERDQQAKLAVAAERSRIAREMHDVIAHNLAVMVALAEGAAYSAGRAPDEAAVAMTKVSATGRQALSEMRRLLGVLRDTDTDGDPHTPAPQPGIADIPELVDQVKAAGRRVTLQVSGDTVELAPGAGLAVYRIVQEALTNALKHAGPTAAVEVRLAFTPTALEIDVLDDGAGRRAAPPPVLSPGQGVPGMVERAASYDGTVDAGPDGDTGWRVHARLPITRSTRDAEVIGTR